MTALAGPPPQHDLTRPDLYLNPYPVMQAVQEQTPAYFSDELDSWVLTRYADLRSALLDPRLSVMEETKRIDALPAEQRAEFEPMRRVFLQWGGRADPESHQQFLRVVKQHFSPSRVAEQVPFIQGRVDSLLDAAIAASPAIGDDVEIDVVNDITHPLSMSVVGNLLGVDEIDAAAMAMLLSASSKIAGLLEMGELDQLRLAQEGMQEVADYLAPHVAAARRNGGPGLFGVLAEPRDGLQLTDEQIVAQGIMFVVVGYHTTANQLANGLQLLFDHPDQRQILVDGQFSILRNAFDEMMRFHGPVSSIRRLALTDMEVSGVRIAAGDTLVLALLTGNRDPSVFEDPARFWVERPNARAHLGFTVGPYSCMGQALARLEGEVFFRTLLTRLPDAQPVRRIPDWAPFRPLGRELATLPVRATRSR